VTEFRSRATEYAESNETLVRFRHDREHLAYWLSCSSATVPN